MSDLTILRKQIDTIDQDIVSWLVYSAGATSLGELIDARLGVVKEIGAYKKLHHLPILDDKRRGEMLQSRIHGVPESHKKIVESFFEVLHDISIMWQKI